MADKRQYLAKMEATGCADLAPKEGQFVVGGAGVDPLGCLLEILDEDISDVSEATGRANALPFFRVLSKVVVGKREGFEYGRSCR